MLCEKKQESIHRFFGREFQKIRKMLNTSIFSIIVLKFNQDRYFGLHVTAAADIRMKKVIESCPRRAL